MRKVWERIINREYRPGFDRPRYYGSCEVVGLTPGPGFVAPVMALDSLPVEKPRVKVVIAGCAECHWGDEPLINIEFYDSVEEAKAAYSTQGWTSRGVWGEHPQGGEHIVIGQGSVWILPETVKEIEE